MANLTERDKRMVAAGLLPVDVDPPRPLTQREIDELDIPYRDYTLLHFQPFAHLGWLEWRRRGKP